MALPRSESRIEPGASLLAIQLHRRAVPGALRDDYSRASADASRFVAVAALLGFSPEDLRDEIDALSATVGPDEPQRPLIASLQVKERRIPIGWPQPLTWRERAQLREALAEEFVAQRAAWNGPRIFASAAAALTEELARTSYRRGWMLGRRGK
jgi:hypothetical protein